MTLREYVVALCNVSEQKFSPLSAKTLLKEITQNDNFNEILKNISEDKFKSYLRKDRNISESFADEIHRYYNREYLMEYIQDLCDEAGGRKRLCDSFNHYCPEINENNVIKKVADLFEDMLNSVIHKNNDSSSKLFINKNDSLKIQDVIKSLCMSIYSLERLGLEIADAEHKYGYFHYKSEIPEIIQKFDTEYDKLTKLNFELLFYAKKYPEIFYIYNLEQEQSKLCKDSFNYYLNRRSDVYWGWKYQDILVELANYIDSINQK